MSEWNKITFSNFVEINPKIKLEKSNEYSFVEMADLEAHNKFCEPKKKRMLTGGMRFENGDTLFARITPCLENGKICQVRNLENGLGFGSTEFHVLRGKFGISDSNFIFYLSRWNDVKDFAELNLHGTSGRQRMPHEAFKELQLLLPPLQEQQAIAEVLSSLDDKIDLLHRNNKTLEEMAETLFRQWFDMSETSKLKLGHIGDFFEETIGGEWGKETLNEEFSVEAICIRGTDIGNLIDGIPSPPTRYLSVKKFQKCKVLHGDIIIEISGGTEDQSTGRARYFDTKTIEMLGGSVVFSNFCRLLRPINKEIYPYLYLLLRFLYDRGDFFNLENGTSGIKNLALQPFLNDELYPIPDLETAIKFSQQVLPLLNKTGYNRIQINNLSKLRDTLLPKLMTGQVVVH